MSSRKRMVATGLPSGWTREECVRQNGLSRGKSDIYYIRYVGPQYAKPKILFIN